MLVLGIETSCDETAAAVVEDGRRVRVRRRRVADRWRTREYGGVVPEVASRQHVATDRAGARDGAVAEAGDRLRRPRRHRGDRGPGPGRRAARRRASGQGARATRWASRWSASTTWRATWRRCSSSAGAAAGRRRIRTWRCWCRAGTRRSFASTRRARRAARRHPRRRRRRGVRQGRQDARARLPGRRRRSTGWRRPANPRRSRFRARCAGRDDLDFSFSGLKTAVATLLARSGRAARGPGARRLLRELPGRGRRRAGAEVAAGAGAQGLHAPGGCGGVAANRGLRAALADGRARRRLRAATSRRPSAAPTTRR